jgi:hypothetical protein
MSQANNKEMIDYQVATLPDHMLESQHFKNWREIFPEETIFPLYNDVFLENLEIKSQEDLDKIIVCESMFLFTTKYRIQIFKNVYKYWMEDPNSSPIRLPDKGKSWFSGQVATLFSERDSTIAMTCFKRNYVELFDYILERNGLDQIENGGLYSMYTLPYYGVINNHIEIVRRGLEVGCSTSMDLFDVAIGKKNLEMFKLLLEFNVRFTTKTLIIAAQFGLPEMYEYFLKESVKMKHFDEYVNATLKNLDNLKYLLQRSDVMVDGNIKLNGCVSKVDCGIQLLKVCIKNAYELNIIKFLEQHYGNIIIEQIKNVPGYLYIDNSVIKKDDLELYTYLRNNGFKVSPSSADMAMRNKCVNISPGLLKKHSTDDLREQMEEALRKEREEEDAADRREYEDQLAELDRQNDEEDERNEKYYRRTSGSDYY